MVEKSHQSKYKMYKIYYFKINLFYFSKNAEHDNFCRSHLL